MFLDKMGLEIMFVDHPIRKQAVLDKKKKLSILHSGHTGIVSKGLTHDIVLKLEFMSVWFWTNEP